MKKFKRDEEYIVNGAKLDRIRAVAKRLYSEEALAENEYRDLSHRLQVCLEGAVIYEDPTKLKNYEVEIRYVQLYTTSQEAHSEEEAKIAACREFENDIMGDIVEYNVEIMELRS
jgi:hypothetical protein